MANRVRISSIGTPALRACPKVYGQAAVDRMLEHWQAVLDNVLPEQPDLIVNYDVKKALQ